jgi:hypothetical protein
MPDRHDNHLINVFFFNELTKSPVLLEESDSQYLIEYEPVEEGAQCEISWQPKCNANEALIAWWEECKIGSARKIIMLSVTTFGTCCRKTIRPVSTTRLWTYTLTVATQC